LIACAMLMRKEVFIAIFIGFILGLIITFGAHTARRSLEKQQQLTQNENVVTPSPAPSDHTLSVTAPSSNAIANNSPVDITGITTPGSYLAALGADDSVVAVADNQGNFTIPVDVIAGANRFKLTAYSPSGSEVSQDIVIVYSTAALSQLGDESAEEEL
jgi:hypothetical protein